MQHGRQRVRWDNLSPRSLMDGTDKYAIVRKIADGGMAEIFLARFEVRRGFQKQVVLKRIRSALIRAQRASCLRCRGCC